MRVLDKAAAIFDRIIDIFAMLAAAIVIFLMLMVSYSVGMRYLFNQPISGVAEISEYLLLFLTFLAATWVLKADGHVKLDVVTEMLAPRAKAITSAVTTIICAIASLILMWYGSKITVEHFLSGLRLTTLLMPPSYLIIFIIPLCYLLLFIQFLRKVYQLLRSPSSAIEKSRSLE